MKKIKLNPESIKDVLKTIQKSKYKYSFGPSVNPTWLIVDEENKKVRFEYGEGDPYNFDEVSIDFLLKEDDVIVVENHIQFKAKCKPGFNYLNGDGWVYGSLLSNGIESAIVRDEDLDLSIKCDDGIQDINDFAFIPVLTNTICRKSPWKTIKGTPIYENDICFYEEENEEGDDRYYMVCKWIPEWGGLFFLHDFELLDYQDNGIRNLEVDKNNFFLCNEDNINNITKWHSAGNYIDNPENLIQ